MKNLSKAYVLALIAAAVCTGNGNASDTASSEISIQGIAPRVCNMPAPSASNTGNTSVTSAAITINSVISEDDASLQPWEATLSYPGVMCNYGATLSLSSQNGGLRISGGGIQPVSGTFLDRIDYTATAKWGNLEELVLNTATSGSTPVSIQASAPNHADLTVTLQSLASNLPVTEGQFQDVLVLKVGPSI